MSALLHRTQMNNRGLQTRPAASPGRMLASRIHLRHGYTCIVSSRSGHCREGVRAEAHAESRVAAAPPQTHREAAGLRGAFASVALAACLALQLPAGLPAQAVEGGSRMAEEAAAVTAATIEDSVAGATESGTAGGLQTVYFGNGCFWGRQKDFVDVEMKQLGRTPEKLTALVGYAAGTQTGPGGKVCYVYSDPRTHYDALGHAEVVQLGVSTDPRVAEEEMRAFAARYFQQFRQTPGGMQRSDPQDKGPAYRNVIGIPGGVNSPVFRVIQEENKYGMELREGRGNVMGRGGATEDDILNTVWVVDSAQLPFYRAERYHQFHNGLGKIFPSEYVRDLRNLVAGLGRIEPTGCPELPF